jgi:hypothetical protein
MPDTTNVRQLPRISCVEAVRALPEAERDKILRRGLDRRIVATLAGAVSQLSGRGDMEGQYGEYLTAVLQWVETLHQDLKKLADIQRFLAMHQKRWAELRDISEDPAVDLAQPIRLKTHIGNINRQAGTASPTAPYATPTMRFGSRRAVIREQRVVHDEIVLVRDRFGAECVTRIGLKRWMLRKLFQEADLAEQEAARKRVTELNEERPGLAVGDLVQSARDSGSAEKLLDMLFLNLEHPTSWIPDDRGSPDQAFTRELDGNFERLLNPFFEKVHHKPTRLLERASGAVKKGYKGVTWINSTWSTVKTVIGVGAIYTAILALGSDAWNTTAGLVREYTTPDEILAYEAQFARERARKIDIADKTIAAVAEKDDWEDVQKTFSEVLANYVRENAGDRVALLFSRYLKHCLETGRGDWQPELPEDRARMPQVADLVALLNVQLFNEGPFAEADGKPQKFLNSAVVDRWPWRSETESNLENVLRAVRDQNRRAVFPLPQGVSPPSFLPPPQPVERSGAKIAAEKIWRRHISRGLSYLWESRPLRYGTIFALVTVGAWALRRHLRRRDQYRLETVEAPPAG